MTIARNIIHPDNVDFNALMHVALPLLLLSLTQTPPPTSSSSPDVLHLFILGLSPLDLSPPLATPPPPHLHLSLPLATSRLSRFSSAIDSSCFFSASSFFTCSNLCKNQGIEAAVQLILEESLGMLEMGYSCGHGLM
ncbi:hypothetical protein PIB30_035561 [Stylosanthes scabra]|uniref:Uncharacterized protein n=1 Tax=Stylosanthes scabra TaxID=79078 RepID=A0ABU6TCW2_9FABA|nr:hypothetical protein [Stylosanthes scabra]